MAANRGHTDRDHGPSRPFFRVSGREWQWFDMNLYGFSHRCPCPFVEFMDEPQVVQWFPIGTPDLFVSCVGEPSIDIGMDFRLAQ